MLDLLKLTIFKYSFVQNGIFDLMYYLLNETVGNMDLFSGYVYIVLFYQILDIMDNISDAYFT